MKILFELDREDNPPLYDELSKFPKGTKRVNRLRTLAHEGLFRQRQLGAWRQEVSPDVHPSSMEATDGTQATALSEASSELFGPSSDL